MTTFDDANPLVRGAAIFASTFSSSLDRLTVGATTAGPHTINAAAVTARVVIKVPEGVFELDGSARPKLGSGMQFGRLVTGDGDDTLEGGTASTVFEPGRGFNSVTGHGPADTLQLLRNLAEYGQFGLGNRATISNATIGSYDNIGGIARLQFTDGTVVLGSNPLVNDVFYAQQNPDVFKAGVAADAHYATDQPRRGQRRR